MGSRANRAIDLAIEKQLKKSLIIKSPKNQMSKFSNYCAIKKYDAIMHASAISDLMDINSYIAQKDNYDNEIFSVFNYKAIKTQSRFNILRLFKPGEILSTVSR